MKVLVRLTILITAQRTAKFVPKVVRGPLYTMVLRKSHFSSVNEMKT